MTFGEQEPVLGSSNPYGGSSPINRLVNAFHMLPGIGPRSAQRLAYHVLRSPSSEASELANALLDVKENIILCESCQNLASRSPCLLCDDMSRAQDLLCVVEEPLDVVAIERTGDFKGNYHVLHGVIAPRSGVGPEDLKIDELMKRLRSADSPFKEVIIATNPSTEGEATALYLAQLIHSLDLKVTRLARGLPTGSDVEYADIDTLGRALEFRHEI